MAQNVPDSAELNVLRLMTGAKVSSGCFVRLFQNDVMPAAVSTLGALTPADYPGYAGQFVTPGTWTFATDTNGKGRARSPELTWTRGAGAGAANVIYGYYVTMLIDAVEVLLAVIRFPASKNFAAEGDSFPLVADLLCSNDPLP